MTPDRIITAVEYSNIKGRLRASRCHPFDSDKVIIIDRQDKREIELTEQQASLLLDDLIACLVKPTLPARWWDRVKFMFRLAQYWQSEVKEEG